MCLKSKSEVAPKKSQFIQKITFESKNGESSIPETALRTQQLQTP